MKFSKIIPIALSLSLLSPAFAAESAQSTINLDMPATIDIAVNSATIPSQTLTPDYVAGDIGTLTAKAVWDVTTNLNGDYIYLTAKTYENGALTPCLYGDDNNLYIIFANIGGNPASPGDGLADGTIADIIASGESLSGSTTPDAIVFNLGETFAPSGAATSAPTKKAVTDGTTGAPAGTKARRYTLHNGTYVITNALSSVYGGSFDTFDTAGNYQAVIKLSHTNP